MSIKEGREYFRQLGLEDKVMEFDESSATVELAAHAFTVTCVILPDCSKPF